MFWSNNLSSNMPKIMSFSLKNRKNHPALGALPSDPLCLRRLGATPDPRISFISLQIPRCTLNYNRRFHMTLRKKYRSNIIKLVSKSAAAVVMDIKYCKLWRNILCMPFWNRVLENLAKGAPNFILGGFR